MTTCSTHVLDSAHGTPAVGIDVGLRAPNGSTATAKTDADGRIAWPGELDPGIYSLDFGTGDWFGAVGQDTFFPSIVLTVVLDGEHTHVALLLGPYSYTTYKGS